MEDTGPMPIDDGRQHRRRGEQRLDAIANNALLKVLQFAITGLALPAIAYGITAMLGRMDALEKQFQQQNVISATTELRMLQTEKSVAENSINERNLRDRVLALEYLLRAAPAQRSSQ